MPALCVTYEGRDYEYDHYLTNKLEKLMGCKLKGVYCKSDAWSLDKTEISGGYGSSLLIHNSLGKWCRITHSEWCSIAHIHDNLDVKDIY